LGDSFNPAIRMSARWLMGPTLQHQATHHAHAPPAVKRVSLLQAALVARAQQLRSLS